MPWSPSRPCPYPGCPQLGYCAKHANPVRTGTTKERGYDAAHKRVRLLCFERDHWRCANCGWEPDLVREFRELQLPMLPQTAQVVEELRVRFHNGERHLQADHKVPIEDRPDLRLVLDNIQTLCNVCHRLKTARES